MADPINMPAPTILGDEWWQQVVSLGLSRKWDTEYLEAYRVNQGTPYIQGTPGTGAARPAGANGLSIAGVQVSPLVVVAGVLGSAALLYLALSK